VRQTTMLNSKLRVGRRHSMLPLVLSFALYGSS
jgi:hypothetical protein